MNGLYPPSGGLQLDLKKGEAILPSLGPDHPIMLAPNTRAHRFKGVIREGLPTLVVPRRATKAAIVEALTSLEAWFGKSLERLWRERRIISVSSILFLGREVPVIPAPSSCRSVKLTEEGLMTNAISQEAAQLMALSWLYRQSEAHIRTAVEAWGPKIGFQDIPIRVTEMSSRWGSCVAAKRLSFCWRQVMAPPQVIDYLAVHEITHMKHQNHSSAYWQAVAQAYPDWKRWDDWLGKNGSILMNLYPKISLACLRQIKHMPAVPVSDLGGFRLVFGSEDEL